MPQVETTSLFEAGGSQPPCGVTVARHSLNMPRTFKGRATLARASGKTIMPEFVKAPGCWSLSLEGIIMFDYNTTKWKRLTRAIMRRDNYMCQLSKRYGKRVPAEVVHHIYPADEYPEYAYEPWNLIALSRKMHNTLHDRNTDALTAEGVALMRRTRHV